MTIHVLQYYGNFGMTYVSAARWSEGNVLRLDSSTATRTFGTCKSTSPIFHSSRESATVPSYTLVVFCCLSPGTIARASVAMTSAPPPTSSDASATKRTFIIGTRQSKLALLQTNLVLAALKEANPDCSFDIHSRETAGDKNTNIAFREFTTKNLWTEELEELLIAGHVDFIVHSLKGVSLVLCC